MAVTHPYGKPVRPCEVVGIYLRNSWDTRESGNGDLDPRGCDYREERKPDSNQDGRANPNAEPPVLRVVNCRVRSIE